MTHPPDFARIAKVNTKNFSHRRNSMIKFIKKSSLPEDVLSEIHLKQKDRKEFHGATGAASTAGNVRTIWFLKFPKADALRDCADE